LSIVRNRQVNDHAALVCIYAYLRRTSRRIDAHPEDRNLVDVDAASHN
jgi:hypothetical protein